MSCAERLRTQAFIDGELDAAEIRQAETHIEGCADCQAFCADAAALSDAIRTHAPRLHAPPSLRRDVDALLDAAQEAGGTVRSPTARGPGPGFWRGALSGAGVASLAAGLAAVQLLAPSPATLAEAVTQAHTRALMAGREIAVASSDHHTVKPWFSGRTPLSPPTADFTHEGFPLVGGRVDRIAGAPAAVLVYRRGRHAVDLFVWADRGERLPQPGLTHGYHSIFWRMADLDFAAVSDAAPSELTRFVELVRRERE